MKFAHVSILFILELDYTARISRINNMLKYAIFVINHAGRMKLISFNGAWYTEYIGTTFVIIFQTLIKQDWILSPPWWHLQDVIRGIWCSSLRKRNNLYNAGLFHVDVSTEVCNCWNNQCILQWISEQPMNKE